MSAASADTLTLQSFNGAATLSLRKRYCSCAGIADYGGASMGPQLYRCGNAIGHATVVEPSVGFNGAATLSLRKRSRPSTGAALGRVASMGPQLYCCGNMKYRLFLQLKGQLQWGRNFIVAEIHMGRHWRHSDHDASMGPQLYRCGNQLSSAPML